MVKVRCQDGDDGKKARGRYVGGEKEKEEKAARDDPREALYLSGRAGS